MSGVLPECSSRIEIVFRNFFDGGQLRRSVGWLPGWVETGGVSDNDSIRDEDGVSG